MTIRIFAAIAAVFLAVSPVQAKSQYQRSSSHSYGNAHNDYHASASEYGPSHNNYNGKPKYVSGQQYSSAPQYTNHPADYTTSPQALSAAAAY